MCCKSQGLIFSRCQQRSSATSLCPGSQSDKKTMVTFNFPLSPPLPPARLWGISPLPICSLGRRLCRLVGTCCRHPRCSRFYLKSQRKMERERTSEPMSSESDSTALTEGHPTPLFRGYSFSYLCSPSWALQVMSNDSSCIYVCIHTHAYIYIHPLISEHRAKEIVFHIISSVIFN